MNELLNLLKIRRSVREFNDQSIPKEKLKAIIDAARFAPTARNIQPWEFVVITDKEKIKELADLGPNAKFMSSAVACIAVFSTETNYFLEDGSAATCNILLAATALGIGSCWIAGDRKPYAQQAASILNAPQGLRLVSLIALGYPKDKTVFKIVQKRNLDELLHWEKF